MNKMQKPFVSLSTTLWALILVFSVPAGALAASDISQVPLFLTQSVPPIAVIDMPKDQSLFMKAYNDYSDLNSDGTVETTYDDSITYSGYFDSGVCYGYSSGMFIPQALADTSSGNGHYCDGSHWSGNFLNWVTMSRMDIVRLILYGGKRITDTSTETVLERAYLPTDAHSWAKYYNGSDIAKLTPFADVSLTPPSASSSHPCNVNGNCTDTAVTFPTNFPVTSDSACGHSDGGYAKLIFSDLSQQVFHVGDQVKIYPGTGDEPATDYMIGGVCSAGAGSDGLPSVTVRIDQGALVGADTDSHATWTLLDLSQTGISFCNTTLGDTSGTSQGDQNPPLLRVASGNYALWSANERWQCAWYSEHSNTNSGRGFRSNGNLAAFSGLSASADNPDGATNDLAELHVDVQACVTGYIVNARCKVYPGDTSNSKPIGLLQTYGDVGEVRFGLFTGSYNKNFSGGVLRSNVQDWASEVNVSGNGSFNSGGIVDALNSLRIYGYSYTGLGGNDGTYFADNCQFQITDPLNNGGTDAGEGKCRSWGNPISEIYLESLRYLAGKQPTPAFVPTSSVLGLNIATWTDPLNADNFCSALDVMVFNTSVATFDDDQMGGFSDLDTAGTAQSLTTEIGGYEGINDKLWFIGDNGTTADGLCSAKTISGLGDASGICPEAPSQHGSYLMDGVAWWAHTNRIRTDLSVPDTNTSALKVDTYGIQLANNVPRIKATVDGKTVTILPAYRLDLSSTNGGFGTGTLVDFKVVSQSADGSSGTYYINWEDSNLGGDFDQDMWGILSYSVSGSSITVTTRAIAQSTTNPQGFGYIISGTTQDGPHFPSGILDFSYTDPTGATGCDKCNVGDPAVSVTYNVGSASGSSLEDPLYYAAKWGGFDDSNDNSRPDLTSEWDADGDGQPDNYFFATNPTKLYDVLSDALKKVIKTESSATSIATNSTRLDTESAIYQARFKSVDWYGQLLAFSIKADGTVGNEVWDAASELDTATSTSAGVTSRNILTWLPGSFAGTTFFWANLSSAQQADLNQTTIGGTVVQDPSTAQQGQARTEYLRGDRSNEVQNGGTFRNRVHVLGDIINSNPFYVKQQDFRYYFLPKPDHTVTTDCTDTTVDPDPSIEACTYNAFVNGNVSRTPVVYVGANDGMLHAFNADTGQEIFAYVPSGVYGRLSNLTDPSYANHHQYFVDGSVNVADAWFKARGATTQSWHTVLVGALGAGGKGVFALDVTDPNDFGAGNILWEYDGLGTDKTAGTSDDDTDLGYAIGQPTIVRLNDGNWYAMFANGYDSTNGNAVLYLIRLDATSFTNTTVYKITGSTTSCTIGGGAHGNGLSTPTPVDGVAWNADDSKYEPGSDRVTDYVYAGDLCGELIKFDLTNWPSSSAKVQILFDARDSSGKVQPITDRPEVGRSPQGGFLVYFGTGSFYRYNDNIVNSSTDPTNSFYAVRDDNDPDDPNSGAPYTRSDLVAQTIIYQNITDNQMVRAVSNNTVNYTDTGTDPNKRGWYLDLVPPSGVYEGERVTSPPLLRGGRIIFTTLIPAPADQPCQYGGSGWVMELDANDGSRLDKTVLDVNKDGEFDDSDYVTVTINGVDTKVPVSGMESTIGIISTPGIIEAGATEYKYLSGSSGNIGVVTESNSSGHGRRSWRQIQ